MSTPSPTTAERTVRLGPAPGPPVRVNERFHGRAAARFVRLARTFDAEIRIRSDEDARSRPNGSGNAKSMFGVGPFSGVRPGHPIRLRARGPDAVEAVLLLGDVLENRARLWSDDPATACLPGRVGGVSDVGRETVERAARRREPTKSRERPWAVDRNAAD